MFQNNPANPRRRFLTQVAAAAASVASFSSLAAFSAGAQAGSDKDVMRADDDSWMKPLKGKHRQFFHAIRPEIAPMLMASNFLDAYRDVYGAKPEHVNAVIGFHAAALAFGFNDTLWSKYEMGKVADVSDPTTKAHALRNVFATGGNLAIDALQKRGVVFLMCNTALKLRARSMATAMNVDYDTLFAELSAGVLPGVIRVPALVVAINRAQEMGFTYVRAS